MFKWLAKQFSSEASDEAAEGSLGSLKNVRALIAQLESEKPERAVHALAELFADVPRQARTENDDWRSVKQLDEFAQRLLTELWDALLTDGRGQTVTATNWRTLSHYYRSFHAAFWHYLSGSDPSEKRSETAHAEATVSACRAMTALAKYMLLQRMCYRDATQDVWSSLNSLVAWATKQGNAGALMEQYPGAGIDTSIEREMLAALLLAVAPTANLLPAQILALDRVLRLYTGFYRIADTYDEQARAFAYEPERNAAPQRWLMGVKARAGVRFFGVGGAYAELRNARDEARSSRELPAWLGATRCTLDDYRDMLERLVAQWSLQPPVRRQRREACKGEILVAHDVNDIRRLVKFSEMARSGQTLAYDSKNVYGMNNTLRGLLDSPIRGPKSDSPIDAQEMLANLVSFEQSLGRNATEPWSLADLSEHGLGATAGADCTWVKVGMMIALRRPDSVDWQIALVRRLNKVENNRFAIGMTKFFGTLSSARLRLGVGPVDYTRVINASHSPVEYEALVLNDTACTLLLPMGIVDTTWKYTLTWNGRHDTVKMEKLIRRGLNFDHVEIAVAEAAQAA